MFSHILVPLDESRLAELVLPHVAALARLNQCKVTLLTVLEPPAGAGSPLTAEPVEWQIALGRAASYLASVKERLQDYGVESTTALIEGDPCTSILEFAKRGEVDLIALTSHGSSGEVVHPLGEVALKIVFGARSSLLLVRSFNPRLPALANAGAAGEGHREAPAYRRVLVPLDGSLRSESALPYAERICNACKGQLHAAAVVSPVHQWNAVLDLVASDGAPSRTRQRQAAQPSPVEQAGAYLDGVGRGVSAPHTTLKSTVLESADVPGAIDELATSEEIDLVVMSAHGAGGGTRNPHGSVALDLLVYGYAPLLMVQDRAAHELRETHAERAAKERQGHG